MRRMANERIASFATPTLLCGGRKRSSAVGLTNSTPKTTSKAKRRVLRAIDAAMMSKNKYHTYLDIGGGLSGKSFLVPTEDLKALKLAIEDEHADHIFLRSSIGSGKSSMMKILSRYDDKIFYCSFARVVATHIEFDSILSDAVNHKGDKLCPDSTQVWNYVKKDTVILIDECHLMFSQHDALHKLIKDCFSLFYVVFTSSNSAHTLATSGKETTSSPALITHKSFIELKFNPGDVRRLFHDHATKVDTPLKASSLSAPKTAPSTFS